MRFPAHLHNALARISSWMTANLLTLISFSSKTEFLFIELKQKLDKIHNSSLNTETQKNQEKIFKNKKKTLNDISANSACRGGPAPLRANLKKLACGVIPQRNHPCRISSRLVKGFGGYGLRVPKIGCFSATSNSRDRCRYNSVMYYRDRPYTVTCRS